MKKEKEKEGKSKHKKDIIDKSSTLEKESHKKRTPGSSKDQEMGKYSEKGKTPQSLGGKDLKKDVKSSKGHESKSPHSKHDISKKMKDKKGKKIKPIVFEASDDGEDVGGCGCCGRRKKKPFHPPELKKKPKSLDTVDSEPVEEDKPNIDEEAYVEHEVVIENGLDEGSGAAAAASVGHSLSMARISVNEQEEEECLDLLTDSEDKNGSQIIKQPVNPEKDSTGEKKDVVIEEKIVEKDHQNVQIEGEATVELAEKEGKDEEGKEEEEEEEIDKKDIEEGDKGKDGEEKIQGSSSPKQQPVEEEMNIENGGDIEKGQDVTVGSDKNASSQQPLEQPSPKKTPDVQQSLDRKNEVDDQCSISRDEDDRKRSDGEFGAEGSIGSIHSSSLSCPPTPDDSYQQENNSYRMTPDVIEECDEWDDSDERCIALATSELKDLHTPTLRSSIHPVDVQTSANGSSITRSSRSEKQHQQRRVMLPSTLLLGSAVMNRRRVMDDASTRTQHQKERGHIIKGDYYAQCASNAAREAKNLVSEFEKEGSYVGDHPDAYENETRSLEVEHLYDIVPSSPQAEHRRVSIEEGLSMLSAYYQKRDSSVDDASHCRRDQDDPSSSCPPSKGKNSGIHRRYARPSPEKVRALCVSMMGISPKKREARQRKEKMEREKIEEEKQLEERKRRLANPYSFESFERDMERKENERQQKKALQGHEASKHSKHEQISSSDDPSDHEYVSSKKTGATSRSHGVHHAVKDDGAYLPQQQHYGHAETKSEELDSSCLFQTVNVVPHSEQFAPNESMSSSIVVDRGSDENTSSEISVPLPHTDTPAQHAPPAKIKPDERYTHELRVQDRQNESLFEDLDDDGEDSGEKDIRIQDIMDDIDHIEQQERRIERELNGNVREMSGFYTPMYTHTQYVSQAGPGDVQDETMSMSDTNTVSLASMGGQSILAPLARTPERVRSSRHLSLTHNSHVPHKDYLLGSSLRDGDLEQQSQQTTGASSGQSSTSNPLMSTTSSAISTHSSYSTFFEAKGLMSSKKIRDNLVMRYGGRYSKKEGGGDDSMDVGSQKMIIGKDDVVASRGLVAEASKLYGRYVEGRQSQKKIERPSASLKKNSGGQFKSGVRRKSLGSMPSSSLSKKRTKPASNQQIKPHQHQQRRRYSSGSTIAFSRLPRSLQKSAALFE
ncbi:hypothetical protein ADUPG1_013218 [Aduncisulcus paluster]|uniref:Uncharacterized protein n=1 Tax=Aduncisulcus paluster TaxID=2918883 RepID=A0ABQ5K5E7_9EUKA|nr:hypothetical protein ADUPG1_013218 [Aduncisulcus paluster]